MANRKTSPTHKSSQTPDEGARSWTKRTDFDLSTGHGRRGNIDRAQENLGRHPDGPLEIASDEFGDNLSTMESRWRGNLTVYVPYAAATGSHFERHTNTLERGRTGDLHARDVRLPVRRRAARQTMRGVAHSDACFLNTQGCGLAAWSMTVRGTSHGCWQKRYGCTLGKTRPCRGTVGWPSSRGLYNNDHLSGRRVMARLG